MRRRCGGAKLLVLLCHFEHAADHLLLLRLIRRLLQLKRIGLRTLRGSKRMLSVMALRIRINRGLGGLLLHKEFRRFRAVWNLLFWGCRYVLMLAGGFGLLVLDVNRGLGGLLLHKVLRRLRAVCNLLFWGRRYVLLLPGGFGLSLLLVATEQLFLVKNIVA